MFPELNKIKIEELPEIKIETIPEMEIDFSFLDIKEERQ